MRSEFITECLAIISQSIDTEIFVDIEKSKVELKDLSTGNDWISLKETICAFLNTDGGIVICGIREREKKYILKGFNRNDESKIIDLQTKFFKDDNGVIVDLSSQIYFDFYPIHDKEVVVVAIYPLSDDKKYLSFDGKFYERKLTQDKIIPIPKLQRQREYKIDLEYAKELTLLNDVKLTDLSIDKINKYIDLLNREIRNETLKPSLQKAKEFLTKQHFVKDNKVTTLGLLVCGDDPFHFLNERAEVDCYYETSSDISKDKKIFRNDVISLMEDTFRYIWGHIKISRTIKEGGKSEPEYPENMIREIINNALAHRDYSIDRFVTVTVEPNEYIEIKNPGSFKEKIKLINTETEIPIRRLIPGIPESKNPKLTSVLKVFDKIESKGRGMASLVNAALDNLIDLPYYELKTDQICLKIPVGKLIDESIESWLNGFENYITNKLQTQLTSEHKAVLAYFYKSESLNRQRLFTILLSESNNHYSVLDQLSKAGLIFEHAASTEENAIYVLDRVLMNTNFTTELIQQIGQEFIYFDLAAKEVLNIIYLYSKYNKKTLRASEITPEVYRRLHGKTINGKKYESLGRSVRKFCNDFEKKGILKKELKNGYLFDFGFSKANNLLER